MDQISTFEVCADVIATLDDKLVLIERYTSPKGLALPGGRKDSGESLEECAIREFREETGLEFTPLYQLHTYSTPGRDPRGEKISTVFVGTAKGVPRSELGKTRVYMIQPENIGWYRPHLVFDHAKVLDDYVGKRSFFL